MATNFPAGIDTFSNPNPTSSLDSPSHSSQHTDANDAIEAIETYILNSAPVLQVVQTIKTGMYSVAQTTPIADVTGLNVTLTPKTTASKILLMLEIGSMGHTDSGQGGFGRIYRGTTSLSDSDFFVYFNSSNPGVAVSTQILDSPSTTSPLTYNVRVWSAAGTVRVNGIGQTTTTFGVSKFTAIEIGP